ncbi:MAG: lysophospholipid acyltransferase family protein [Pseudomonadota bacterium]
MKTVLYSALLVLLKGYLKLVWATARVTVDAGPLRDRALADGVGMVYGIWHGRMLFATRDLFSGMKFTVIVSRSEDGAGATRILDAWGIGAIRGSSASQRNPSKDKGGREALSGAIGFLKDTPNGALGLTPDGPRGPRFTCKPGIAAIASRAGRPVVVVGASASPAIEVRSWDRFLVPLPFARIAIRWSEPLDPPEDLGRDAVEAYLDRINSALRAKTREADEICGRTARLAELA